MKFKIRNEFMPIIISIGIISGLFAISLFILPFTQVSDNLVVRGAGTFSCAGLLALLFLVMIVYFIDRAVGATIKVDDTTVTVSQLFGRKKIAIDEIEDMEIEDYFRREIRRRVYRMKLTIYYSGGRKLVLKDNASKINGLWGFVTGEREELPYQEVTLYQACKYIESKMK